eukprot:3053172-Rhodomonas_salina.3
MVIPLLATMLRLMIDVWFRRMHEDVRGSIRSQINEMLLQVQQGKSPREAMNSSVDFLSRVSSGPRRDNTIYTSSPGRVTGARRDTAASEGGAGGSGHRRQQSRSLSPSSSSSPSRRDLLVQQQLVSAQVSRLYAFLVSPSPDMAA